jgi:hypothetical protein
MILDEIADYLASLSLGTVKTNANTTPGAPGWWIYKGAVETSNQDNAIFLTEFFGGPPEDIMGSTTGSVECEIVGLQVLCRSLSYETARAKSAALWDELHKFSGTLGATRYLLIQARSSPFPIGRDQSSRWMIGFNCTVTKEI